MFVGVPAQRYINAAVQDHNNDRVAEANPKHTFRPTKFDTTSGHLDLARSNLVRYGLRWSADYLVQIDADVALETDWDAVLSFLAQDFSQGAGVVFSPTTSLDWRPQVHRRPTDPPLNDTAPFVCDSGAGGFMVLTRAVAEQLKVLGTSSYFYGTESGKREEQPLYCVNLPGTDSTDETNEDVSLMRNVRDSTGLDVVCDPRILTGHLKPTYRPSYRPRDKIPAGPL